MLHFCVFFFIDKPFPTSLSHFHNISYSSHFQPCPEMSSHSGHFQPYPAISSHLQPIPTIQTICSHYLPFQPFTASSSLFKPIPEYSRIVQHISAYSNLFQPIPARVRRFGLIWKFLGLCSIYFIKDHNEYFQEYFNCLYCFLSFQIMWQLTYIFRHI